MPSKNERALKRNVFEYTGPYSGVVDRCARLTYSFEDVSETVGINVIADNITVSEPQRENDLELVTVTGTSTQRNSGTPDLARDWVCRIDVETVGKSYITMEYSEVRKVA
jgi:hypothetical protein